MLPIRPPAPKGKKGCDGYKKSVASISTDLVDPVLLFLFFFPRPLYNGEASPSDLACPIGRKTEWVAVDAGRYHLRETVKSRRFLLSYPAKLGNFPQRGSNEAACESPKCHIRG